MARKEINDALSCFSSRLGRQVSQFFASTDTQINCLVVSLTQAWLPSLWELQFMVPVPHAEL